MMTPPTPPSPAPRHEADDLTAVDQARAACWDAYLEGMHLTGLRFNARVAECAEMSELEYQRCAADARAQHDTRIEELRVEYYACLEGIENRHGTVPRSRERVTRAARPRSTTLEPAAAERRTLTVELPVTPDCQPPMHWGGPLMFPVWGWLAHEFIEQDYAKRMGVQEGVGVYFDDPFAGPIDWEYVHFLRRKSGRSWRDSPLLGMTWKRPDIVIHEGGLRQFEEIKPNSPTGRASGREKVDDVDAYMAFNDLPYVRGTSYVPPTREIEIKNTKVYGRRIRLSVEARRLEPGLIVYRICVATWWEGMTLTEVLKALLFILSGVLAARKLVKKRPPKLPAPEDILEEILRKAWEELERPAARWRAASRRSRRRSRRRRGTGPLRW
jgi:hypothetical protein